MSSSRIEQIIEEIEEYVESCRYQPLSTTKIVVNKEELEAVSYTHLDVYKRQPVYCISLSPVRGYG